MQRSAARCGVWLMLLALLAISPVAWSAKQLSTALFYASNPPVNILSQFDRIVLEAANITQPQHRALKQHGASTYAYFSVGETTDLRPWANLVADHWVLGQNATWGSKVLDLTSAGWQGLLMQRADALVRQGYNGLFLDTMDSYQLYAKSTQAKRTQETALANFLGRLKQRHPQLKLIANRGFEVLPQVAGHLEAVAAESLYRSWDNNKTEYGQVSANDRQWLLGKLREVKDDYQLDVIVIDYVPPDDRSTARDTAIKIAKHGFTPWVATPALDYIGISTLEVLPREVLMLFDSRDDNLQAEADVHRMLAVPIEYMGYVPVYHDLSQLGLPRGELTGRYAGILSWSLDESRIDGYQQWLTNQIGAGVPIGLFGHPGIKIDKPLAAKMGLELVTSLDYSSMQVTRADELIGFEAAPLPRLEGISLPLRSTSAENSVHLRYSDHAGEHADLVITGPWGGVALSPGARDFRPESGAHWIVDPYKFLRKALQLSDAPMPDVTTENGRRLWLAHIDGDAMPSWAEMPGRKLGAEVIETDILQRYPMPHTISIVEAEMRALPLYNDRRPRMADIAKRIFASPRVEIATHTFSHPYTWYKLKNGSPSGTHNLPVAGYRYSPSREIAGSVEYIDSKLAPPGKRTKVVLWSGDALPGKAEMSEVERLGLINMNGGNTVISTANPSLSFVSPMVRTIGDYLQPYAPIMNENVYTNEWTGPFDGYRKVIETLQMTDRPHRLKPINIYYHFYAGTKAAMMRALTEVYDWTMTQSIFPVYVSEYAEKVPDFRKAGVARYLDGRWKISGLGSIRSLRMVNNAHWPDLSSSRGLVGATRLHDGIYLHTNGASSVTFSTPPRKPANAAPYLISANAAVQSWRQTDAQLRFRLTGNVEVEMELGASRLCSIRTDAGKIIGTPTAQNTTRFVFPTQDTGYAVLDCQT